LELDAIPKDDIEKKVRENEFVKELEGGQHILWVGSIVGGTFLLILLTIILICYYKDKSKCC
jgi:hypothetical protein